MKLEYIADGSPYCPLIRLYEFTDIETSGLRTKIAELAQGSSISIALHDLNFVTPIGDCELILIVADDDQGILASDSDSLFMCMLSQETWEQIAGLIESFCKSGGLSGYQWLDETSDISLLLSPDGTW
jgi:hypothetical protein